MLLLIQPPLSVIQQNGLMEYTECIMDMEGAPLVRKIVGEVLGTISCWPLTKF
jgi:hypothetical protein